MADTHLKVREAAIENLDWVQRTTEETRRTVDEKVSKARETVEGWVRKG